jgi:hypothetical protein
MEKLNPEKFGNLFKLFCAGIGIIPSMSDVLDLFKEFYDKFDDENTCLIYVLRLCEDKYYIGKTKNEDTFASRIERHKQLRGCEWTSFYPYVETVKVARGTPFDEDLVCLKYMAEYGIENVRGGTFSRIKLPEHQLLTLGEMLRSATDKCFCCGETGHFSNRCKNRSAS